MLFRGVRNQNTWFLKNVCMDVCMCMCVCAILSEIVPTYYILLVYTTNYILLYFFR